MAFFPDPGPGKTNRPEKRHFRTTRCSLPLESTCALWSKPGIHLIHLATHSLTARNCAVRGPFSASRLSSERRPLDLIVKRREKTFHLPPTACESLPKFGQKSVWPYRLTSTFLPSTRWTSES